MAKNEILAHFADMVDMIADLLGPWAEVVLHDFSKRGTTIVKIRNGHVTGRVLGGTITNLGLQMFRDLEKSHPAKTCLSNYKGVGKDGHALKCGSLVIRSEGRTIGALCINIDLQSFQHMQAVLNDFCVVNGLEQAATSSESFMPTFASLVDQSVDKALRELGKTHGILSKSDKLIVLGNLEKQGVFMIRGAVRVVSRRLKLAAPTVYKYLSSERNKGNNAAGSALSTGSLTQQQKHSLANHLAG